MNEVRKARLECALRLLAHVCDEFEMIAEESSQALTNLPDNIENSEKLAPRRAQVKALNDFVNSLAEVGNQASDLLFDDDDDVIVAEIAPVGKVE